MTAGPRWRLALIAVAAAAALAPYTIERAVEGPAPEPTGPPSLAIASPADGSVFAGNVVEIALDVNAVPDGARYAALADRAASAPGTVIPLARGVVFSTRPSFALGGLAPGTHAITVVLADATGARIGALAANVSVRTTGPATLTATAPVVAVEGDPWTISVAVSGITLAEGGTHLHYLIDLDLPPPGVPISEDAENVVHTTIVRVPLTGLATGEHHVWIVAGDAQHRPLSPYVADVIFVKVGT